MNGAPPLSVAYLTVRYPHISHTFVQREIEGLRRAGVHVEPMAIHRAEPEHVLSLADRHAFEETFALLPLEKARIWTGLVKTALQHPRALMRTAAAALRLGGGSPRQTLWQFFYLAEALLVWSRLVEREVRHVHADFANVAADVSRLTVIFGNAVDPDRPWTWSFTMHGSREFYDVSFFDLAGKVRSAAGVVCISDFTKSQLCTLVPESCWSKLKVVHCGVDVDRFAYEERKRDRCPLRILSVGRLVPEKGLSVCLEALRALVDAGHDVELDLVGDGPGRLALEEEAARLGIRDRCTFSGAVGQDEIKEHFERADIYCLSSFAEGLPVVLMEAMSVGLPVVATMISGIPELVRHEETGLLVRPARADDLAAALSRLILEPELARDLAASGRALVEDEYDSYENASVVAGFLAGMQAGGTEGGST